MPRHRLAMSLGTPARKAYGLFVRVTIALFVLVVFVGLGVLVYVGELQGEALVLLAGVIIGYLARLGTEYL